ncbi:MAG: hypothetical protein AABX13_00030 [Nanoarchaeota archaeon]
MIIADACSVILLAKASVLEGSSSTYNICISTQVYEEVLAGKQKQFQDALLLERLAREKKIKIIEAPSASRRRIQRDFRMGEGEASTIALGIKERAIVATDNRQGRKAARIYGLPLVGSIDIVVSLTKKGIISKEKAQEALRILREEGWFSPYLIEQARGDLP